jgi:hypothetical protein
MHISLIVQICLIKIYTRFTDLHGAMSMQNRVFWLVTPRKPMTEGNMLPLSYLSDSSTFLKNYGTHLYNYTM